MKDRLLQPGVFNLITIAAMLFCIGQGVGSSQSVPPETVIEMYEALIEEGAIEDEGLSERLSAERQLQTQLAVYSLATLLIAILANIIANYLGRGRHFENSAKIRELEAEIRGLQWN